MTTPSCNHPDHPNTTIELRVEHGGVEVNIEVTGANDKVAGVIAALHGVLAPAPRRFVFVPAPSAPKGPATRSSRKTG